MVKQTAQQPCVSVSLLPDLQILGSARPENGKSPVFDAAKVKMRRPQGTGPWLALISRRPFADESSVQGANS